MVDKSVIAGMNGILWKWSDGGRAAAGYKGTGGDCVVRAIAIATGEDYREVYEALTQSLEQKGVIGKYGYSATYRGKPAPERHILRYGINEAVWGAYLRERGWKYQATPKGKNGRYPVHLRRGEIPSQGTFLVHIHRHLTVVVDGVLHDRWDCSNDGKAPVLGWLTKVENEPKESKMEEVKSVSIPAVQPKRKRTPAPVSDLPKGKPGRRPIPAGVERRKNVNISLPPSEVEKLRTIGGGSASAGISQLLSMYEGMK